MPPSPYSAVPVKIQVLYKRWALEQQDLVIQSQLTINLDHAFFDARRKKYDKKKEKKRKVQHKWPFRLLSVGACERFFLVAKCILSSQAVIKVRAPANLGHL